MPKPSAILGSALAFSLSLALAIGLWTVPAPGQEVEPCPAGGVCEGGEPAPSDWPLEKVPRFFDARALLQICAGDELERAACQVYVAGIYDASELLYWRLDRPPPWCAVVGASASQLREIAVRFIQANPRYLHLPAAWAVDQAMRDAFSCTNLPR